MSESAVEVLRTLGLQGPQDAATIACIDSDGIMPSQELSAIMVYLSSMAEVVSVDKAGRIVIPKAVRDAAGIDERAKLLIAATEKGRVVLQKLDVESLAERLEKELAGKDIDAIVRKVREEIRARIRKDYPDLLA